MPWLIYRLYYRIGRKKTLYISFIIVIASSIGLSWANSFIMYVVLRFIIGASNAGIFMTGFVIGMLLKIKTS